MEFLHQLFDLVRHLDPDHMRQFIAYCGPWVYAVLFAIIFCETGLVVTPFLPGDSLLFVAGSVAATGAMDYSSVLGLLMLAAVAGDSSNYWLGRFVGPKVFTQGHSRWLKKEHLDRTHAFFAKYGGKAVIIGRFVPIIRTFTPFVAGIGAMTYLRFLVFSIVGTCLWVGGISSAGYFFGSRPFVKQHYSLVVAAIIVISLLPPVIEFFRHRGASARKKVDPPGCQARQDQSTEAEVR